MSYCSSKLLNVPSDDAVERVTEELIAVFAIGLDTKILEKATPWES